MRELIGQAKVSRLWRCGKARFGGLASFTEQSLQLQKATRKGVKKVRQTWLNVYRPPEPALQYTHVGQAENGGLVLHTRKAFKTILRERQKTTEICGLIQQSGEMKREIKNVDGRGSIG